MIPDRLVLFDCIVHGNTLLYLVTAAAIHYESHQTFIEKLLD